MKNKRLIFAVSAVVLVLIASFFLQEKKTETVQIEKKKVGVLQFVSHPALDEIYKGVKQGLADEGYTEDKIEILFQNGQADQSKLTTMSQQLVQKKSDVLIGIATPAAQSLATTTSEIPIVLGAVTDPVGANLVADNEAPGGNITGVSDKSPVNAQMALAKQLLPTAKTVGILYSSAEDNSKYQVAEAEEAAKKQGFMTKKMAVPSSNEIAQTVQVMSQEVDFIYIPLDNTIANAMQTVVSEANKSNKPIITSVDTMVQQGGLATVGINQFDLGVQAGKMAADILSGKSEPATTPIYTFTEGDTIINTTQAEKLGITIPEELKNSAKLVTTEE
ncbi:ABC transporter substrate-binding protein [Enterococcus phoeniculicola]|jgi:putative ABC transport system substrate-binding protein|uniref:ABC transporter substrate-binding protein n=1 Tax=Enterococcus phoeniculicola ATCC BAA-412 TaxID=1158610 RepID=R3TX72_9ENTE|nr:tryptophan ABC transporter substrate-binding protein [Enterococcus phoeniculicola]EOL46209.1 ABC transporter substrate-binding protein [Enterococcus phoeniculicola ATCC BAA-412]EOT76946.1 ABC transporter substrate-binding protein [Enterococcus phoeniculicola ATCC BAA-412]OJG71203.1 ABC transporter substrate-binding protein [Enterococcus phoeniculicola]